MSYLLQPDLCMAVIAAWPDMHVAPQLVAWLRDLGVDRIEVHRFGDGRMDCGYNMGIEIALGSDYPEFIFADRDIWPGPASEPFLKVRADLVSCRYDTGQDDAWSEPDSFHTGLWRTSRQVLQAVGIRPFTWHLNEKGTGPLECLCRPFARRVKAAGFTVAHDGLAHHAPRTRSPLPMRMILSNSKARP